MVSPILELQNINKSFGHVHANKNINLTMTNDSYDNLKEDYINKVVIKDGNIISGGLDKSIFTKTSKGLIHIIYNDLGPERTKDFIDDW